MIVVADTSPLNYLVFIEQIQVLEALYTQVLIPPAVQDELLRPETPLPVRSWMESPPPWLDVRSPVPVYGDSILLGAGESQALALAQQLGAYQIVMDETLGRSEAVRRNLKVIGTLGVLREAHRAGLLDFAQAAQRLQMTTFRISPQILRAVLDSLQRNIT